jgi:hypothetical protein
MDIDPNDILSTNVYITKPNLTPNITNDSNEEFKKYYEKEMKNQSENKLRNRINDIELKSVNHNELYDDNMNNTQIFNKNPNDKTNDNIDRFTRETKTLVSIDSRDRTKTIYPKPNNFKIFLGKTFSNVKKIELVSLEFPNTDAVINSKNNKIYWVNQEDIDLDITITTKGVVNYPVYLVELRTGSYTVSSLQNEITNKLNSIRRKQGTLNGNLVTGDYHYFVITLDVDTDIVTFISLILTQLPNNAFFTSLGSGIITVSSTNHGYSSYDNIYITGAKQVAGLTSNVLNGFHQITVINDNLYTFETTTKAGETTNGGGNTLKSGKKAPFQLLWGERYDSGTIAQNIGFPIENSSQLITTNITSLENLFQMTINTVLPHDFLKTYEYIGKIIRIGYLLSNAFIAYKTFQIIDIPNSTSILVQVTDNSIADTLNNNIQAILLQFDTKIYDVLSYETFPVSSILVNTQTDHNYNLSNISDTITLANTSDPTIENDPNYDGNYVLNNVPSTSSLIIPGVIGNINIHQSGLYGTIPRKNPLSTWSIIVESIDKNYININGLFYSKITTREEHRLIVGDSIFINNLQSSPLLIKSYEIISILNPNSFLIQLQIVSLELTNITNGLVYIGTGLITMSYPSHGFNSITSIENGTPYDIVTGSSTVTYMPIIINTFNNHNLSDNDIIRLSNTNTEPSIDGGGYIVTVIDEDTFSIVRTPSQFPILIIPNTVTGIIGLSNSFYIYGSEDVGGISKTLINGYTFEIREIIDINTFTFIINNVFSTSTSIGGGSYIYISSLRHGFNGIQQNIKNNLLNRSINLQGEDYCFLTCPQLSTMLNTGIVKNVFARISLDQPPGFMCFKFLSNSKIFNTVPLYQLSELDFSLNNYNNTFYDFQDLDWSFVLEITEVIDVTKAFNVSSKRGIIDTT